jgi:hypothetical protein
MAEVTSGTMLTVIVMDWDEQAALQYILRKGVEILNAEGAAGGKIAIADAFQILESFDIEV